MREGFTFRGAGALELRGYLWRGGDAGTVVLVHGYGEHVGRYGAFASWLAGRGFRVAAFDLRGHGESPGRRGHISSFGEYLEDLDAFLGHIQREVPSRRTYLLGHSLGGLIVIRYLERHPRAVGGAILSAPALGFSLPIPGWKRALARIASALVPWLSLPSGIDPAALSRDPAVVEACRRDPLVHRVATARWFTEALRAQRDALREAAGIRVPLLLMYGTADRLVSQEAIRCFFAACGSPRKELLALAGFCHEVLNEVGKEEAWGAVLGWLGERP